MEKKERTLKRRKIKLKFTLKWCYHETKEKKNLCKVKCTPYSTTSDDLRIYISNCTMRKKKAKILSKYFMNSQHDVFYGTRLSHGKYTVNERKKNIITKFSYNHTIIRYIFHILVTFYCFSSIISSSSIFSFSCFYKAMSLRFVFVFGRAKWFERLTSCSTFSWNHEMMRECI